MRGRYPDILTDKTAGKAAKTLFDDAQKLLKRIVDEKLLKAKAIVGFYPANSTGDDIEIYTDESRKTILKTFHTLRQQTKRVSGKKNVALSDYIAAKDSGIQDYMGFFVSTAGLEIEKTLEEFKKTHDDYNSIMMKALADRLAEAFAEHLHELVRKEYWGYSKQEKLSNDDLIHQKYRGIRPAPGYPACPEHSEKRALFELLDATKHTGVALTENFAMTPAASVSGFYFSHPEAAYFAVGKMEKDQIEDYAKRKKMKVQDVEKWLSPYLAYK